MSGYEKLVIVDQYEERHSNRSAVRRACDVMLGYLSNLNRPLPEIAARAIEVAKEYNEGVVKADALRDADLRVSRFLKETEFHETPDEGTISVVRASGALLKLLQDPTWGGGASEALSNFLEWVDEFDRNCPLFEQLLEQSFGKPSR